MVASLARVRIENIGDDNKVLLKIFARRNKYQAKRRKNESYQSGN